MRVHSPWRTAFGLALSIFLSVHALAADDQTRYRVVPDESELRVLVFSAGIFGKLGHNHVITSHGTSGTVVVGSSPAESSIDLSLPVNSLTVDDPDARAAAGSVFEGTFDQDAIEATREHMLGDKLLDAKKFDTIRVVSDGISGDFSDMSIHARITIKGTQHDIDFPVRVSMHNGKLIATGRTTISHSELGLSPFTAGFGTVKVSEDMTFNYRIVAVKEP